MPGPPPKPDSQRRRRNATPPSTRLPAEGRQGPPPPWPLARKMTRTQERIWISLWGTPQAVAWEAMGAGIVDVLCRYTRLRAREEQAGGTPASVLSELRRLEDDLGILPAAMLRLRWEIASDEVAEQRDARPAGEQGVRARLRAVEQR